MLLKIYISTGAANASMSRVDLANNLIAQMFSTQQQSPSGATAATSNQQLVNSRQGVLPEQSADELKGERERIHAYLYIRENNYSEKPPQVED